MSKSEIDKLNTRCAAIEHVISALVRQLDEEQQKALLKSVSESTKKYGDPDLLSLATRLGTGV